VSSWIRFRRSPQWREQFTQKVMCAATDEIVHCNNPREHLHASARSRSGATGERGLPGAARPLDAASRRAEPATELQRLRVAAEAREFHAAAVVGSIIFFTSVIFVAGKPLTSACLRMMASSLAR
jgi:hypothetical protein